MDVNTRAGTELALLATIASDPTRIDLVAGRVIRGDFSVYSHAKAYDRIVSLHESGEPLGDLALVIDHLSEAGVIGESSTQISIREWQEAWLNAVPNNAVRYCKRVVKSAVAWEQQKLASATLEELEMPGADPTAILSKTQAKLERLGARTFIEPQDLEHFSEKFVESVRESMDSQRPVGITSGIPGVDRLVGGLVPGELVVIGARPSNGKTALTMQILMNAAKNGNRSLMVSLEMKGEDLAQRVVCAGAGVSSKVIRTPESISEEDFGKLSAQLGKAEGHLINICEKRKATVRDIRSMAKILQMNGGLDVIAVDYIALVEPDDKALLRRDQITEIAKGLRAIGEDLRVPVVVLSQLNRKAGEDAKELPCMANIRESGGIEEAADVILLLHNPPEAKGATDDADKIQPKLIVAKARQASPGSEDIFWNSKTMQFDEDGPGEVSNGREEPVLVEASESNGEPWTGF